MVEPVVSFVLQKVDNLLHVEGKLWSGFRTEVEGIKGELCSMQAFLRDADAREERGEEGVKVWVKQVRQVAHDVEDVLDEFELLLDTPYRHGFVGSLQKFTHQAKHFKENHQIVRRIEDLKTNLHDVSQRRQNYNFNASEQTQSSSCAAHIRWHDPRGDALLIEEAELVGIEKPRNELIGILVDGESRLGVVSVVGMAGLGKTTLVKKVYDHEKVKGYFQHHAWIAVSETFQIENFLMDMIEQLFEESNQQLPQGLDTMKDVKLKVMLKEFLQNKRYIIVFDDIWSPDAWQAVKYALPDNNCSSRIIVTTRLADIASFCIESYGHVYKLKPLKPDQASALFHRKAFQSDLEHSFPLDLEKISLNILKRCGGLPLAITAIGGLLSTKHKTIKDWQRVHDSLGVELESNDILTGMKKILLLSYEDLPYYLKSCFLYLCVFPEDHSIRSSRVIRLWIAEGFMDKMIGSTITIEEVAEGYLNEFINRNLVQVAKVDIGGRVREFRVHDLMRELIVSKAQEQNFAMLDVKQNQNVRRLSIHSNGENVTKSNSLQHLRSLFMFGMENLPNSFHYGCGLLGVLDMEGVPLEMFPSEFTNLRLLRYLSLRKTNIKMLPNSIEKLQNLQTLDLKQTHVSELPIGILKLQNLRHLLVYFYDYSTLKSTDSILTIGFKAPVGIESLVSLQKLSFIEANNNTVALKELGRLKHLRRLGVIKLRKEDGIDLCSSIEKMSNLNSLDITSIEKEEFLDLQSLSSPPLLLERLYMKGRLEKLPHWIPSLLNLVKIHLRWSRLLRDDDPLEALQDLPNLVQLELYRAYDGEHLCFKASKFQKLKVLSLRRMDGLKLVTVEEGAMFLLRTLNIGSCGVLEKVPLGIDHLTNLKDLRIYGMPDDFKKRIFKEGEDYWRIAHIPRIRYL